MRPKRINWASFFFGSIGIKSSLTLPHPYFLNWTIFVHIRNETWSTFLNLYFNNPNETCSRNETCETCRNETCKNETCKNKTCFRNDISVLTNLWGRIGKPGHRYASHWRWRIGYLCIPLVLCRHLQPTSSIFCTRTDRISCDAGIPHGLRTRPNRPR